MRKTFKYRLYPTPAQRTALTKQLDCCRWIYNKALETRKEAWEQRQESVSRYDTSNMIPQWKAENEWLNQGHAQAMQEALKRLDLAFRAFFRRVKAGEKPGYPRFKGRRWYKSFQFTYGDGLRLKDRRLYVQNIGLIRVFQHRPLPDEAKIKTAILKRDNLDHWHVVFQLELPDVEAAPDGRPEVGIDMGLETFAALSTGELIENPRWSRSAEEKLATLQRRRARCKKGSRKYAELSRQIRRLHEHTANQRRDFQHKESAKIAARFGLIAVEDLNIKGLARSHVSKSIADVGWGYFLNMLSYKAERAGGQFVSVNPNGTSQYCSGCGCRVEKSLSVRVHSCPYCGLVLNRDENAARNVLSRAGQALAVKCSAARGRRKLPALAGR